MNTGKNQPDLQGGNNTAFLLKEETRIELILNFKHPRLEWERIVL
jgi:hypothetical protein